jgi:DNA-binding MarR family transcriptional regulator
MFKIAGRTYPVRVAAKSVPAPAETEWLTPDELQTWRALHGVISVLPATLGDQLRREVNLSFIEYYVLACLSEQPDQTLRMSQLAAIAGSELSRLSHLMRRLETRGLVRRAPDPKDGRVTLAHLTAAGHDLAVRAAPIHVAHVRHLIFDVLDATEQRALRGALTKIVAKLIASL